jgi:hypothetical protein
MGFALLNPSYGRYHRTNVISNTRRGDAMQSNANRRTYTSQADEEFFGAIGRLTISWGHLELGLDCMVEILYRGFGGNTIYPEMPRQLQRKITFLRKSFRKLPIGEEAIQGYLKFLDQVETAAQTRHDIIHGIVIEQAEHSGEAVMVRIIRKHDSMKQKRIKVNAKGILESAVEAQHLGKLILQGVNQIYTIIEKLPQTSDHTADAPIAEA